MRTLLYSATAAFLVALVPAALGLWSGRSLAPLAADPALPERLMARDRRLGMAIGGTIVTLVWFWPRHAGWTLPLLFVAHLAAGYRLRRVMREETWSIGIYLWFYIRLIVAMFGWWFLLAATPAIVLVAPHSWAIAAALSAVLLTWSARFPDVTRFLLCTKPVDDPALMARFARMVETCGLAPPRFEYVELRGGVFANAFALPSRRRSAVLLTETVLTRFDPDEIAAISAHESAHLEHHNRPAIRRLSLVNQSLIVLGAVLTPVARLFFPAAANAVPYLWAFAVLVMVMSRARVRQRHEIESDLRAVVLTGDPEPVIRALIKLHVMTRIPRRWTVQIERQATHPSLARRIRAIRALAGGAPAALGEAATFGSADGTSSVTFLDDHLVWNRDGSAPHTLPYGELEELRVDARGTGGTRLVAVHRAGLKWELALPLEAVDRVQGVLDIVDARLSGPAAAQPTRPYALARMLTGLTAGAALATGQYALGFAALLPVARPAPPLLAASGVAAIVMAALLSRDPGPHQSITSPAVALLLDGVAMLCVASTNRQESLPAWLKPLVVAVGICGGLTWAAVIVAGPDIVSLHQAARAWPATVIWPLALATGLAFSSSRALRCSSLPIALGGLLAGAAGSTTFLEHVSRDPFVASAGPMTAESLVAAAFAEFSVPFEVSGIQLSHDGRRIALRSEDKDEQVTFHLGLVNGPLASFEGQEGVFIDDRHLLLLDQQPHGAFLREVRIDRSCQVIWQQVVPGLLSARLSFDPAANRWRLLGWNRDGDVVRAAGRLGGTAIETEHWSAFRGHEQQPDVVPTSGRDALAMEILVHRRFVPPGRWRALTVVLAAFTRFETHLWTVGPGGAREIAASPLAVTCDGALRSDELPVCAAFDGTRTRLFTVDAGARRLTPAGWLPNRFIIGRHSGNGWLTGWWIGPAAMRVDTREVVRPPRLDDGRSVTAVGASDHLFATASGRETGSQMRLYAWRQLAAVVTAAGADRSHVSTHLIAQSAAPTGRFRCNRSWPPRHDPRVPRRELHRRARA